MKLNINLKLYVSSLPEEGKCLLFILLGSLSSRLQKDVDKMGRTVALNANAMVRSTVRACFMLAVMWHLSWELTVLTCVEIPLLAIMQNKYINLSTVSGALAVTQIKAG